MVLDVHAAGCPDDARPCANVRLEFPLLHGDTPLARAERAWVEEHLGATDRASAEAFAAAYLEKWELSLGAGSGVAASEWFLERTVVRIDALPSVVVLALSEFSYEGGAHPMSRARHQAFLVGTGTPIGQDWWFRGASGDALREALGARFREDVALREDAGALAETVGWEAAPLDNFIPGPEGITFHFDPYEIAPYAVGPIRVLLPWSDLESLLSGRALDLLGNGETTGAARAAR